MLLGYGVVDHAKVVLGRIFFETILVSGLGRLSQTCKRYRYLQRDRDSLLGAIVGSTRLGLHLEYRLSLFGMMPRAIIHQLNASIRLIQAARAYERTLECNRREKFPLFYAYAYHRGICVRSLSTVRRGVWEEVAKILCEMLESLSATTIEPWGLRGFENRRRNARYYLFEKH
jgi:hypothetical protein